MDWQVKGLTKFPNWYGTPIVPDLPEKWAPNRITKDKVLWDAFTSHIVIERNYIHLDVEEKTQCLGTRQLGARRRGEANLQMLTKMCLCDMNVREEVKVGRKRKPFRLDLLVDENTVVEMKWLPSLYSTVLYGDLDLSLDDMYKGALYQAWCYVYGTDINKIVATDTNRVYCATVEDNVITIKYIEVYDEEVMDIGRTSAIIEAFSKWSN
jgi:hypothetical protein